MQNAARKYDAPTTPHRIVSAYSWGHPGQICTVDYSQSPAGEYQEGEKAVCTTHFHGLPMGAFMFDANCRARSIPDFPAKKFNLADVGGVWGDKPQPRHPAAKRASLVLRRNKAAEGRVLIFGWDSKRNRPPWGRWFIWRLVILFFFGLAAKCGPFESPTIGIARRSGKRRIVNGPESGESREPRPEATHPAH